MKSRIFWTDQHEPIQAEEKVYFASVWAVIIVIVAAMTIVFASPAAGQDQTNATKIVAAEIEEAIMPFDVSLVHMFVPMRQCGTYFVVSEINGTAKPYLVIRFPDAFPIRNSGDKTATALVLMSNVKVFIERGNAPPRFAGWSMKNMERRVHLFVSPSDYEVAEECLPPPEVPPKK